MTRAVLTIGLLALCVRAAAAQAAIATGDTSITIRVGGFADVYYAYDVLRPPSGDRAYTTQPARHNEFNVNLAHLELRLSSERVRGRMALQSGTSVQSNYAAEPRRGAISGPEVARFIQEAVVGVRLTPSVWVDAGVYLSHIGQESWISRDNPTYSRSLTADFTPYYSAGAKATWQATPTLSGQLHVINGWQNIAENNGSKAVGVRLDWQATPALLLGYDNFIGNERADGLPRATRVFNEVFAKVTPWPGVELWLTANLGTESEPVGEDPTWYSLTFVGRARLAPGLAANARGERYADPDQAIVATGLSEGLETWGGSVGLDATVRGGALWRTELRGFFGDNAAFTDHRGALRRRAAFAVTSLAITF